MRAILTYHSIDTSGSLISCDPDAFARHVAWLASGRVRVTSIDELIELPATEDAVALTFDDGFVNFRDVAAPLLLEHDFPVTVFVVAGLTGGLNTWDDGHPKIPALRLLDWDGLALLHEQGVNIGAHGLTHASLTSLDSEAVEVEVAGSADRIAEHLGRLPTTFAYPYGDWSAQVSAAVGQRFRLACTTEFNSLNDNANPLALPRLDMWYFQQPGSLDAWGSALFKARLTLRQGLRRARRMRRLLKAD